MGLLLYKVSGFLYKKKKIIDASDEHLLSFSQYVCVVKLQDLFMLRVSYAWLFWETMSVMNHAPQTNHSQPCFKRGGQGLNKPSSLSVISVLGSTCIFPVQTFLLFFLSFFFFIAATFTVHILVGQRVWLIPLVQNQILEVYHTSNYLQWQQALLISPSVWRLTPPYHGWHAWVRTDLKHSRRVRVIPCPLLSESSQKAQQSSISTR